MTDPSIIKFLLKVKYIVNLREHHSTKQKVSSAPTIKFKDLVLVHDYCAFRHLRRAGVMTELYYSKSDHRIQRASVRLDHNKR